MTTEDIESFLESSGSLRLGEDNSFDWCVIGIASRCGMQDILAYDVDKVIEHLTSQGMSHHEAQEWYILNIEGSYMGEGTPIYINKGEDLE
jgi:hypothetical protein